MCSPVNWVSEPLLQRMEFQSAVHRTLSLVCLTTRQMSTPLKLNGPHVLIDCKGSGWVSNIRHWPLVAWKKENYVLLDFQVLLQSWGYSSLGLCQIFHICLEICVSYAISNSVRCLFFNIKVHLRAPTTPQTVMVALPHWNKNELSDFIQYF